MRPAEQETTIADMFDRIAGRYDTLNALLSLRQDARWRNVLVSWLPKRQNGSVLDVACGTGDILTTITRRRPDYRSLVGVDISENMLTLARKKLGDSAKLQKMSAEELSLPEESFDAVSIGFGLRNVVNKEKALSEFFRVLKPGGVLLILEFFPMDSGILNRLFQFYFQQILPLIGGLLSDRMAYRYLPRSVGTFYTPLALAGRLRTTGFQMGRQRSFLFGSCRLVEARK